MQTGSIRGTKLLYFKSGPYRQYQNAGRNTPIVLQRSMTPVQIDDSWINKFTQDLSYPSLYFRYPRCVIINHLHAKSKIKVCRILFQND